MSDHVRSQCFGLSLAFFTAIGCIAYERLVKSYSYFTVGLFTTLSYVPFWFLSLYFSNTVKDDFSKLCSHKWSLLTYFLSGATGPLWYLITRKQNVLVGAIYEVKYIVVMAIMYLFLGSTIPSWNTLIGVVLAMFSIYFISK